MTDGEGYGRATGHIDADAAAAKHTQEEMAQFGAYLTLRAQAYVLNEVWHGKYDFGELRTKALEAAAHANTVSNGRWPNVEIEHLPLSAVLAGPDGEPVDSSSTHTPDTSDTSQAPAPQSPPPPRESTQPEADTATPSGPPAESQPDQQQHQQAPRRSMAAAV